MREGTRPHPNRGSGRDGINMSIWIVTTMTYRPYILAFLLAALACTSCTFDVGNLWDKEEDVPPVLPVPDEPTPTSSIHDGGFVAYEPPVSPDPPVLPIGNTWHNHASAGWDVTLKDYLRSATRNDEGGVGRHSNRGTVLKLDRRFREQDGFGHGNSHCTVGGYTFDWYANDHESNRPSYGCHALPGELPTPLIIRIYKHGQLHTVLRVDSWAYKTVTVPATVEVP